LNGAIPTFIVASKEHLQTMGSSEHNEKKEIQKEEHRNVHACLEEIKRILEQIRAKYTNEFNEGKRLVPEPLDDLDEAAAELFDSLAALKTPKNEEAKLYAASQIPANTKATLDAMSAHDCPMELKKDLVGQIRQARDGDIPQYFEAVKCMEQTLEKAKAMQPPPLQIDMGALKIHDSGGPKDLLEAAKRMCAALSGLNITLDSS